MINILIIHMFYLRKSRTRELQGFVKLLLLYHDQIWPHASRRLLFAKEESRVNVGIKLHLESLFEQIVPEDGNLWTAFFSGIT